jgi:ribosomal 50S subunit-recycling heat shock protein
LRTDLFLKLAGIAKTRMAAKRLCDSGKVLLAGKTLKPSHELEGGEDLSIDLPFKRLRLQVLGIPPGKSVPRKDRTRFAGIEETSDVF